MNPLAGHGRPTYFEQAGSLPVAVFQEKPSKTGQPIYGADIIWMLCHTLDVSWIVEIGDEFEPEFLALQEDVQMEILALTRFLQQFGPQLGRPALTR